MNPSGQTAIGCVLFTASLLSSSCAVAELERVVVPDIPHVRQKPDFCGEACAEMVLRSLKSPITQDDVFAIAGVPLAQGRGCYTPELVAALKKIGFNTGTVWYTLSKSNPERDAADQWKALHADLVKKIPSMVCMKTGADPSATEHIRLVVGYDPAKGDVLYHEPEDASGAFARMPLRAYGSATLCSPRQ
jgi:hypothetical protein